MSAIEAELYAEASRRRQLQRAQRHQQQQQRPEGGEDPQPLVYSGAGPASTVSASANHSAAAPSPGRTSRVEAEAGGQQLIVPPPYSAAAPVSPLPPAYSSLFEGTDAKSDPQQPNLK